ncbi:acyl-CoA dehydrogenase family protein [Nocardia sp. CA-129566]|uniref:acyl-CoA dehydrogenase family protein n=1 Tax=Nocardia sp. CA-129566 TaxID=3239976 RepID=UPI003D96D580
MITWTAQQQELRDAVVALGPQLSEGHVTDDRNHEFPRSKWKLLARTGLFALPFAAEWGGLGQDLLTTMYVLEGLGYACRDGGLSFSASTHLASTGTPVSRFGSAEVKSRYMQGICEGDLIGAHAITEPSAGSDAMAMRTTAVLDGDVYVLDGSKAFVSNGPIADLIVVYARTESAGSARATTAFVVERDTPGLQFGGPIDKMGLRTSPMCELFLDNCRVPVANVLGRLGSGFFVLDYVMKREILYSFIINVGEMQHRFEKVVEYAKIREQFGRKIGSNQAVSSQIVDMKIGIETARMWLYETAVKLSRSNDVTIDIAISKLITSRNALSTALSAVQVFGAYGYMTEHGLEQDIRNAVAGTIYSGTTEVQYSRVAAMLGL